MKLYIGGSSQDIPRINHIMEVLKGENYTITHDWTQSFKEEVKDYEQAVRDDLAGIFSADMLILVFEKPLPYKGTHTELGLAIAWRKPVIILGKEADKNIFSRLENVSICYSLMDVIELIEERRMG